MFMRSCRLALVRPLLAALVVFPSLAQDAAGHGRVRADAFLPVGVTRPGTRNSQTAPLRNMPAANQDTPASVVGHVMDRQNRHVAGAVVMVKPFDGPNRPHGIERTVRSDEQGRFHVTGLAAGEWIFEAGSGFFFTFSPVRSGTLPDPVVPRLESGATQEITLVRLRSETLYGQVRDPSGRPVSNRDALLISEFSGAWSARPVHTDADGFYKVAWYGFGGFGMSLLCKDIGYTPVLSVFVPDEGEALRRDFRLLPAAFLEGEVVAADGKSPAPAEVLAPPNPTPPQRPGRSRLTLASDSFRTTSATGHFRLTVTPNVPLGLWAFGDWGEMDNVLFFTLQPGEVRRNIRIVLSNKNKTAGSD